MTNQRIRCLFCYLETVDAITASHEHLLSKPVAKAFGIDRTSPVARMNSDMSEIKWRPLNGIKQRIVCTKCNNGWMNQLEHQMVEVAQWLSGSPDERLGEVRARTLHQWGLKTHMILCFLDGNAGRFGDEDLEEEYVVPPFTAARQMYEGDENVYRTSVVGVSRSTAPSDFIWSFGFPNVRASDGVKGHARFAPATVLTVGDLQLWIVIPLADAADVYAPDGVRACSAALRPADLVGLDHPLSVESVTVDFG